MLARNAHTYPPFIWHTSARIRAYAYTIEIYTDGSKNVKGVGSGLAIFVNGSLTVQLRYKLAEKYSNNQAEQLAIVKALTDLRDMHKYKDVNGLQPSTPTAE